MNEIKFMSPVQGLRGRPAEKQNPESEGYDNVLGGAQVNSHGVGLTKRIGMASPVAATG